MEIMETLSKMMSLTGGTSFTIHFLQYSAVGARDALVPMPQVDGPCRTMPQVGVGVMYSVTT